MVSTQPTRPILKHIGDTRQSVVCDVSGGVEALNTVSLADLDLIATAIARRSIAR